jgi:hypothetical protein
VIADDAGGEGGTPALGGELGPEAVGEAGGPDAGRVEGREDLHGLLHGGQREAGLEGDVGWRLGEETPVVECSDQVAHGLEGDGFEVRQLGLLHEMFLQGGLADE